MDVLSSTSPATDAALTPMPPELTLALAAPRAPAPKRERTRRQLIEAALQVFAARGVDEATIQDVATQAGMAAATVYNHFAGKDELVQAAAVLLARGLCERIGESCAGVAEGAERMAIGNRRCLGLSERSPMWAMLLLDVTARAPVVARTTAEFVRADLRLGIRQKAFSVASEAAALDMVAGTIAHAMRMIALGLAPAGHAQAVTATVLTGLGLPLAQAREVARRPLPPLRPPEGSARQPAGKMSRGDRRVAQ